MRSTLLAASMLLTACADLSAPVLPDMSLSHRTLCLAQPEYIEVVEDAVAEWEAAAGRELLTVTTERVPGCTLVTYMRELPAPHQGRAGQVVGVVGAVELHMRYDVPYPVLLHELGHVLGLDHVEGRESIMNEGVGSWSFITELDSDMLSP